MRILVWAFGISSGLVLLGSFLMALAALQSGG
jgi:hypothetical protein